MVNSAVKLLLLEALHRFGHKLVYVLETAVEIAKRNRLLGNTRLGDFDYRTLVEELNKRGISYSPSQMLRILEREYNLIETTYHSGNQHWYRFKDLEAIEKALSSLRGYDNDEDPEVAMLRIQIKSLRLKFWIEKLKRLAIKPKINKADISLFQEFAFKVLPKIVRILRRAEQYEDQLSAEIALLTEIIELAKTVAERLDEGTIGLDIVLSSSKELASEVLPDAR